ncbi:MAG: hypothetical protein M1836_000502 [Candelina mexicana]|nr:MAG: hypothetical protein M1836_000502 [Candelina mexicana]
MAIQTHPVYACSHPQQPMPNAPFTPLPVPGACRDCHLAETRRAEAAIRATFDPQIETLKHQLRKARLVLWRSWDEFLEKEIQRKEEEMMGLEKVRDEAITEHWTEFGERWGYGWW